MGLQVWGSNGGYQGKNGANIGKWLNGQNIIGPLPHPTQVPPTTAQLNQRTKFGLVTSWLRVLKGVIRSGYNVHKRKVSPWSTAVKYNLNHAVTGLAPNFEINYPLALFCKGELSIPLNLGAVTVLGGEVKFDWLNTYNPGFGADTDEATFVVYNADKGLFTILSGIATRVEETYTMQLPTSFVGDQVYCYMSLLSADGKVSSDSVFAAALILV